jgi:hypothetical protein
MIQGRLEPSQLIKPLKSRVIHGQVAPIVLVVGLIIFIVLLFLILLLL